MSRYIVNFHIDIIGLNILLKIMFNSNVNFLDLNIWYDKILNKLETSVYLKPTNNISYLKYKF